jgi:3-deoxy-D-manno-octulosonic-acid transferase
MEDPSDPARRPQPSASVPPRPPETHWPLSIRAYDWILRGLGGIVLRGGSDAVGSGPDTEAGDQGSKLARGLEGRRRERERFARWAAEARNSERPLVWLHAPSVGEGLQARVVLEALQEASPGLQSAYTHFSPSAEGLARRMPADVSGYLPWDTRPASRTALEALRPDLLAFTKTEVWPVLTMAAVERGIPVVLVAATLPAGARRRGRAARAFLAPAFQALSRVLAISEEDGARFAELGVAPERVMVTGDPGVDSAWSRARAADPEAPYLAPFHRTPRPTLVAGSTWGADERVLIPALRPVRDRVPGLRLVIAPHEPDEGHLVPLERCLAEAGWSHRRLGAVEADGHARDVDAVVVDRVGVLAHLYSIGSAGFVGGGFHRQGLHSVLEPAAAGLPVAFGPRFGSSLAAEQLQAEGGGVSVSTGDELSRVLLDWLGDAAEGGSVGARARAWVRRHRGAASRTVEALLPFLS